MQDLCLIPLSLAWGKNKDRTDHKFTMFLFTNKITFYFANPGNIIEDYMSNINFEIASPTVTIQFQRFAVLFLIENSDFSLFPSFWLKKYGNIIISRLTSHVLHLEPFMVFHKEFEIQECIKSIIKSWMNSFGLWAWFSTLGYSYLDLQVHWSRHHRLCYHQDVLHTNHNHKIRKNLTVQVKKWKMSWMHYI